MPIATEAIRQIPIFGLLGSEDLALVAGMLVERDCDRGAIIMLEGTPRDALFYLRSGLVACLAPVPSPQGSSDKFALGSAVWRL